MTKIDEENALLKKLIYDEGSKSLLKKFKEKYKK